MNTPEYILMDTSQPTKILTSKNGGEWIEFYAGNSKYNAYIKHHMFWRGTGLMGKHAHRFQDENILVVSGTACYYLNNVCYYAKAGEIIKIPSNAKHVNPFNAGEKPLVLIYLSPSPNLIYFFLRYYSAVNMSSINRSILTRIHRQILVNKEFKGHIEFSKPKQLFHKLVFGLIKQFHVLLEKLGVLEQFQFNYEQPLVLSKHKRN